MACPASIRDCHCETLDGRRIINCRNRQHTDVPSFQVDSNIYDELTLGYNDITSLKAEAFKGLNIKRLDVSDNKITAISGQAFVGIEDVLQELVLHVNQMSQFPKASLAILSNLKLLHIKGFNTNSLPNGAITSLTKLQDVKFDSCKLTMLSSSDFSGAQRTLTSISVVSNLLTSLPISLLSGLTNLETLSFAHNQIQVIPTGAFSNNRKLSELDLSNNNFNTIKEDAFSGIEGILINLNLQSNSLTDNQIIPIGKVISLQKLNLGYNSLTNIPSAAFLELSSLYHLNMHGNKITTLHRNMFEGVTASLKILMLAENQITIIASGLFQQFSLLEDLNLEHNENLGPNLNKETFAGLENTLKTINLATTGFTSSKWVAVKDLASLTSLLVRDNAIGTLPAFTLQKMTSLQNLDLYNTQLPSISQEALHGPENSLVQIYMGKNGIQTMSQCVFFGFGTQFNQLHLTDNPLVCDCELRWLRQWIEDRFTEFQMLTTNWKCKAPEKYVDTLFRGIEPEDFTCDVFVPAPECKPIVATTLKPEITPSPTPQPGISSTTKPTIVSTSQPILLIFTQVTSSSAVVGWTVESTAIVGFTLEYRKFGSTNHIDSFTLAPSVRQHHLEDLEPAMDYVVCLTTEMQTNIAIEETSCNDITTKEVMPDSEEVKGPVNTNIIIGSILGALAFIVLLVLLGFLVVRCRSDGSPFNKHLTMKKPPILPSRTEMPRMGYNSKRFSRGSKSATEIQNASNNHLHEKMDHFTPEQRDKILNMMTTSGGSTMSVISTGSTMRYVPDPPHAPLPPRPQHLEGYLNPAHIQDEDPENHIYSEIGNDYQEVIGAGALTLEGATGGVPYGKECYI